MEAFCYTVMRLVSYTVIGPNLFDKSMTYKDLCEHNDDTR
jgi:hypothetical protein